MLLPVRPQILHWIEFGSIGGKEFQPQTTALLADKVPYHMAAMTGQAVPNDQQLARQVAQQMRRNSITCGLLMAPGKRRK